MIRMEETEMGTYVETLRVRTVAKARIASSDSDR